MSIDCIEVETLDEGFTSEPKKMIILEKFTEKSENSHSCDFLKMIIFFGSDVKPSFELSTSINSIDTLFLPHDLSFEIFPSRK